MQLSNFWKIFLKTTQYGGAVVSFVLNSILMFLILFRSPAALGNYKYLMLYIVIFQITYSILDVVAEPTILSNDFALIVFRNFKQSIFGREHSYFLLIIYCGFFVFSIELFAIHFIYRYGAADNKFRDKYLSGRKLIVWFLMPVVIGMIWGAICFLFFHYDTSTDVFVKNLLLETYDIRIKDLSYVIVPFYPLDEHNKPHPDPKIFLAVGCLGVFVSTSLFSVFYFGIKCYLKLSQGLASIQSASEKARSLQKQLFLALVVQTSIPVILMHIPVTVLFLFPMINVDVGILGGFTAATIAIYPAIDPLPTMFIIKNYRNTLLCRSSDSNKAPSTGISPGNQQHVAVIVN